MAFAEIKRLQAEEDQINNATLEERQANTAEDGISLRKSSRGMTVSFFFCLSCVGVVIVNDKKRATCDLSVCKT